MAIASSSQQELPVCRLNPLHCQAPIFLLVTKNLIFLIFLRRLLPTPTTLIGIFGWLINGNRRWQEAWKPLESRRSNTYTKFEIEVKMSHFLDYSR